MDKIRQRKLEARANRQESMKLRYNPTVEKTVILPQPTNMVKNEVIKVKEKVIPLEKVSKSPVIAVEVKRGRGRPRKETTEKINKVTKHLQAKKTVKGKGKK